MNIYLHFALYTGVGLVLLTTIGNLACRWLFHLTGLSSPDASAQPAAGRVIGSLERIIIAIGIIAHSWEVLAAVIALKTISRFKEMDEKSFAEYFLVGSLFSIFWATLVTAAWLGYDHYFGLNLRATFGYMAAPA